EADVRPELRSDLATTRDALSLYLDEAFRLGASAATDTAAFVRAIRVELGDSLVPLVDPQQRGAPVFDGLIPDMRQRVADQTGVTLPGLLMRGNFGLGPADYEIQLDEVPIARGTV